LYVQFLISLKHFVNNKSVSENAIGFYAIVKMLYISSTLTVTYYDLLSNYIMMHDPQNVN